MLKIVFKSGMPLVLKILHEKNVTPNIENTDFPILPLITPLRTKSQALKPVSSYNEFSTDYNPIPNESHRRKQWINK